MNSNELLQGLVECYSPTGETSEVARFLVDVLNEKGFDARIDEVGNVIAEKGEDGKTLLLVGHMDTVHGKIPVRVEQNKLFGRGSVDAKGCLATFISAAHAFKGKVVFAACCDEEGVSNGAREIVKNVEPDFIVLGEPSNWDAVTLGYRGSLNAVLNFSQDCFHPSRGESVADKAIEFVNELKKFHTGDGFNEVTVTVREFNTSTNGLKETVSLHVCLRVPPGFDFKPVDAIVKKYGASFVQHVDGVLAEKNNELVKTFLKSIRAVNGTPRFKKKTGTSDMNVFAVLNCPIVTYGPGDSNLDHTPNEHINLDEYAKAISVLENVLAGL